MILTMVGLSLRHLGTCPFPFSINSVGCVSGSNYVGSVGEIFSAGRVS